MIGYHLKFFNAMRSCENNIRYYTIYHSIMHTVTILKKYLAVYSEYCALLVSGKLIFNSEHKQIFTKADIYMIFKQC